MFQLSKEKERLQAMMQHLHMKPQSEKSDQVSVLKYPPPLLRHLEI